MDKYARRALKRANHAAHNKRLLRIGAAPVKEQTALSAVMKWIGGGK